MTTSTSEIYQRAGQARPSATGIVATNRRRPSPFFDAKSHSSQIPGSGLDTVRVAWPIERSTIESLPTKKFIRRANTTTGAIFESVVNGYIEVQDGLFINAGLDPKGQTWATLDCSPARILYGTNTKLARILEVYDFLEELMGTNPVIDYFGPVAVASMKVHRLDCVRDFAAVQHVGTHLDGLSMLSVSQATMGHNRHGGRDGQTCFLSKGTRGRYLGNLYNKTEEIGARPPITGSVLRFEAQLHTRTLLEFRPTLGTFTDLIALGEQGLFDLTDRFFKRCRYHEMVRGKERGMQHLEEIKPRMTPRESKMIYKVVGYLSCLASGIDQPLAPATKAEYRRLARAWNISPADFCASGSHAMHLSFADGRQILHK